MDTKQIVRDFLEGAWNYEKRMSFCSVLAPDYVMHGPTGDAFGCAAYQEAVAAELENIGDMFVKVDDLIAEGDRVVARTTTTFELHGEFMGAYPPGHTIRMQSISVHRVVDGRVAESWETYDRRCLLRDLGSSQTLCETDRLTLELAIADRIPCYAESAEVITPSGAVLRGRAHIHAWLATLPPPRDWKLSDVEIDGAGELAYVRASYAIARTHGKYLEVWRNQADGAWRVIREIWSADTPRVRLHQPVARAAAG